MNNYKIDDDTTKKVLSTYESTSKKKDLESLVNNISKINSDYITTDIPKYSAPEFEKMDMPNATQDEIVSMAEKSLSSYKQDSINKIEDEIDSQEKELNDNKQDIKESVERSKSEVVNYYDTARENASNDALKRGLARSSIVINKLDAFNNDEIASLKALDKEYTDSINAINFELNSLSQQKQKALSDFDIAYAVKLNDKIASLNEEFAEKQAEVVKYNNQILEKEQEYKQKYDDMVAEINNDNFDKNTKMVELVAKYGEGVADGYKKNQITSLLDSYFANMSSDDVLEVLGDENIRSALGSNLSYILERYL